MALGVAELRRALLKLGGALDSDIGKLVVALATQDPAAALAIVTDAYPELASPYLAAAGDLTATWYEDQPQAIGAKPFTAQPAELPAVEQLAANGRYALTTKAPATVLKGAGRRQLFKQHRDTVISNANRERVAWVREARPGACGFCRMLATRVLTEGAGGAPGLYRSEDTANANHHTEDAKGHDHCRCIAVPMRSGKPYTVPGYVHDWLDDYENVSRDESGRLLDPLRIAALMEQRGAERGDPVNYDDEHLDDKPVEPVDLDAGQPPAKRAPAGPRAPLALPAGKSAGRLAIDAPKGSAAFNRPPIALGTGRTPKELTAGPKRLAIEARKVPAPDPGAIAEWLDAEQKHVDALNYWRDVDDEPLPPAERIEDTPPADPAQRTKRDVLREAIAAAEAARDEPDERTSATPKQRAQRRGARGLAVRTARRELELAEADGSANEVIVEKRKRAKARPLAEVEAERRADHDAAMDKAVEQFEAACESGDDEAIERASDHMEAIENAEVERRAKADAALAKIADKSQKQRDRREAERQADQDEIGRLIEEEGYEPDQAEAEVVAKRTGKTEHEVLVAIRKREFMRECAGDGISGGGFEAVLDAKFRLMVEILYMEAEDGTNGSMINRKYALKFDPKNLWDCNEATARKVMSEEMAGWLDSIGGRMTKPVMREMILDGETNFARKTVLSSDFLQ